MNGILSYAAPRARSTKAMTYGILSAGVASLVCALPTLINAAADLLQFIFARPGAMLLRAQEGMLIVLVPALAMWMLPVIGLLFAGMSVASSRRDYPCAMIGFIVNISGLIAGMGAVFLQ
ncbi:MAG: hypothetical protein ACTHN5_15675 [Phycisphaerae bacterium]